jgi:hypothetical protein
MSGVYSVEGKLGTGKTKFAVWRAKLGLLDGRRVASNVDLVLPAITPRQRSTFIRVPDKPTAHDLEAIGLGYDGEKYDEDLFGILILDELGTWLNARSFQDKDRAGVLDWLIHARKKRWEVYLLVQNAGMIDKQVREALIEYECKCLRLDKVKIPVVGWLINDMAVAVGGRKLKRWGYLPKLHCVAARVGEGANKVLAERWFYRGTELHACYNTEQSFSSSYAHGAYTALPPWDWQPEKGWFAKLKAKVVTKPRKVRAVDAQRPPLAPPPRVLQLLRTLPPEESLRHFRRLEGLGLV